MLMRGNYKRRYVGGSGRNDVHTIWSRRFPMARLDHIDAWSQPTRDPQPFALCSRRSTPAWRLMKPSVPVHRKQLGRLADIFEEEHYGALGRRCYYDRLQTCIADPKS